MSRTYTGLKSLKQRNMNKSVDGHIKTPPLFSTVLLWNTFQKQTKTKIRLQHTQVAGAPNYKSCA